jgi:hypothetical protein
MEPAAMLAQLASDWPPAFHYDDVREFYDEQLHRVIEALRTRDPKTAVWTWYEPEQTVGFWVRRMMQETVVHRADVESAIGPPSRFDDAVGTSGDAGGLAALRAAAVATTQ